MRPGSALTTRRRPCPWAAIPAPRLIAFTYAANIWGSTLTSTVPVKIDAQFAPLACTATSAVLGSAGATTVAHDFPNAPKANTWYPIALANKLSGADQAGASSDISASFNSDLGMNANCLPGLSFYLGLDNNHGAQLDFVTVLLHEMGHGLGFQTFTNGQTGSLYSSKPSVWDSFMLDTVTGKTWVNMTAAERKASGISDGALVWNGANVKAAVPNVLSRAPMLKVPTTVINTPSGPLTLYASYEAGSANFGAPLTLAGVTGTLEIASFHGGTAGLACSSLVGRGISPYLGKVVLVDRGTCNFAVKAKNVQNAGGIAMVVVDNVVEPVASMTGVDATVTIPSIMVTSAAGAKFKSIGIPGKVTVGLHPTMYSGTDATGMMRLYTPPVYEPGSSVSHYTKGATRNVLMEPAINDDLSHTPTAPTDLTLPLLKDIGW